MLCRAATAAIVAVVLVAESASVGAKDDEVDVVKLYEEVVRSGVFIVVPMKDGPATGSGTLIDADQRLVLTVAHLVGDENKASVQFPIRDKDDRIDGDKGKYLARVKDRTAIAAKVLHRDLARNLALLQLDKVPAGTPALRLAEKNTVPGAVLWNIGCPGAVPQLFSVTQGRVRKVEVVEVKVADHEKESVAKRQVVIATNPSAPGDSGGPAFDRHGRLVAVSDNAPGHLQQVQAFTSVEEVRAFLAEKKVTIKGDGSKESPKK
jgi:serine protease Do